MIQLVSTINLSIQNFGQLLFKLEHEKFKKFHPLELFFHKKNGKIFITDCFFDKILSFKDLD